MTTTEQTKLLQEYNRLYKENCELYSEAAKNLGISEGAMWILYTLSLYDKPFTQSELCEEVFMPKQTVNSALKKLEQEGHIILQFSENNKKSKQIILTDSGKNLADNTVAKIIAAEKNVFDRFGSAEVQELFRYYGRYIEYLRSELKNQL